MDRSPRVPLALLGILLLSAPGLAAAQPAGEAPPGLAFDDVLFTGIDAAFRVAFDDEGDLWYTTEGGLVHVDVATGTRELFTGVEGLPSSYSMGLAARGAKVYVATDRGLAIVDRFTGAVEAFTRENSGLPALTAQDVALDGEDVWVATRQGGVARWNQTTGAWTVHNTSTSASPPLPVRRIVPQPSAVWAATEGNGLWRHDRASGAWTSVLPKDGLASATVLSVLEQGADVWVGTDAGLQRWTPANGTWRSHTVADGMPHARVLDLDLVPNAEGGVDLWASTPRGAWQLDPATGLHATHGRTFGILGDYVLDNLWSAEHGWAFGTERGVSHFQGGTWRYYTTSPRLGPGNGPFTARITSASTGDGGPYLWFGTHQGLVAYRRPTTGEPGAWFNLGPSQHYPGSVVNAIDAEGNTTWFATNNGTFGYDREANRWISRVIEGTRNLVYGVEADKGELWIPFFGEGLLAQDLRTGVTRTWNLQTVIPIPDVSLLDVRVQGNDVWVGAARGLLRLDRVTGSVQGFWTMADGIPGGTVYRVLPDGPVVWLGTKEGGVARFDVAQGRVTQAWNGTTTPGFRAPDVRALHREGSHLWAGTIAGLWRLDVDTGEDRMFNASNSGLVQDFVQGISSADGLLYLATFSGVARMDLATGEFLPMRDGPGVVRGTPPASIPDPVKPSVVSVRIDSPRDGAAVVAGPVTLRGVALHFGGRVDRVEVRVGEGPWMRAVGTDSWEYVWDATDAVPEAPVTLRARAFAAGETSLEASTTLTPVVPPTVPLALEDLSPGEATAGRAFTATARVQGDPPLATTLFYKTNPNATVWSRLDLVGQGGIRSATIPAREMREGELLYYMEARSGRLSMTAPEDVLDPTRVPVGPAPRALASLTGPTSWRGEAGKTSRIPLQLANEGTEPMTLTLHATGLRAPWVTLDPAPIVLAPGQRVSVDADLAVPGRAFTDRSSLAFEARQADAEEPAATLLLPLDVVGADAPASPTPATGRERAPLPGPVLLIALAAGALLLRRRRA